MPWALPTLRDVIDDVCDTLFNLLFGPLLDPFFFPLLDSLLDPLLDPLLDNEPRSVRSREMEGLDHSIEEVVLPGGHAIIGVHYAH